VKSGCHVGRYLGILSVTESAPGTEIVETCIKMSKIPSFDSWGGGVAHGENWPPEPWPKTGKRGKELELTSKDEPKVQHEAGSHSSSYGYWNFPTLACAGVGVGL